MAVPKQKHTKSRRNKRRGNIFLKKRNLILCSKCGKAKLPHVVCQNCGFYRDKEIIDVLRKLTKKERKAKEKEIAEKDSKISNEI